MTPGAVCACGLPLHYSDPKIRVAVEAMVAELGPLESVTVAGKGTWRVPRHFIALHGIKAWELPDLAARFGFEKVDGPG